MTRFPKIVIGVALALIFVALGSSAVSPAGPAQSAEKEIVTWVRENAVQLDYEDWRDVDVKDRIEMAEDVTHQLRALGYLR